MADRRRLRGPVDRWARNQSPEPDTGDPKYWQRQLRATIFILVSSIAIVVAGVVFLIAAIQARKLPQAVASVIVVAGGLLWGRYFFKGVSYRRQQKPRKTKVGREVREKDA